MLKKYLNQKIIFSIYIYLKKIFVINNNNNLFSYPDDPSSKISVPLITNINIAVDLNLKVLLCNSLNSFQFQVFEMTIRMPKFINFMFISNPKSKFEAPTSNVSFYLKERIPRVLKIK